MQFTQYQVDAFSHQVFGGNPAAVLVLESWWPDALMQQLAAENNLAETAFVVAEAEGYRIRWFTPLIEVDLCGHATLAAAHVLFNHFSFAGEAITFYCRVGTVSVSRDNDWLTLDFPAAQAKPCPIPASLQAAIGVPIIECRAAMDYLVVIESEAQLRLLTPDMVLLKQLDLRAIAVTAPGINDDFVCRFFAPKAGIDEDPVTGSAYTLLVPYWHERTGKTVFQARQLSAREGEVRCHYRGDRVDISGQAVEVMVATLTIPDTLLQEKNPG